MLPIDSWREWNVFCYMEVGKQDPIEMLTSKGDRLILEISDLQLLSNSKGYRFKFVPRKYVKFLQFLQATDFCVILV